MKSGWLLFLVWLGFQQDNGEMEQPQTGDLVVTITDLESRYHGHLLITLYDQAEGFPADYDYAQAQHIVPIENQSTVEVTFKQLPFGEYAVAVLHDEDGDRKMDFNWLGMPTEGWVCSNEIFRTFRSPYFREAKFTLQQKQHHVSLQIHY